MGKPRGFIDIKAKSAQYRNVEERLKDFNEVELLFSEDEIREQALRCMDCGIPFCHGCGCPLGNLIPEVNEYVSRGHWKLALGILLTINDFPEFTGRICPALCEAACTAGLASEPVSIRQIEISLVEKGFREKFIKPVLPAKRTGKNIAVIGSGPAGLSAANRLNKMGHSVTIFEKDSYAGGLLRYGIPDFKLSKKVVQRRIDLMSEEGIRFETGIEIGKDITANYLLKRFDAICLSCGAKSPRELNIPGKNLKNIYFAMDYLTQQNKILGDEPINVPVISVKGKKVLVIGGGDTGSDCVGTANRQGASSITQIEIMPKPPEQRSEHTPWPQWPYQLRTSSSHKEGCNRLWGILSTSFIGENDKVSGINAVKVSWETSAGGFPVNMKEIPNSEFSIDADMIFLSMGFSGPERSDILMQLNVLFDNKNNVKVNEKGMAAGVDKVFAAGDIASGASLVVRAIKEGKEIAKKIDAFLSGQTR